MAKTKAEIQRDYEKRTNYAAQEKYKRKNIKRVPLDMDVTDYERMKEHAKSREETVNGFIKRAINETIKNDKNYL